MTRFAARDRVKPAARRRGDDPPHDFRKLRVLCSGGRVHPIVHHLIPRAATGMRKTASYRTYALAVAAVRGSTGAIRVRASLRGGPERFHHDFALDSDEADAAAACDAALAELRAIIDDLWLGPLPPATAYGR